MGDFGRIYPSRSELEKIMPDRIFDIAVSDPKAIYFGNRHKDGGLKSFAYFMPDTRDAKAVRLCFIFTDWKADGQGLSGSLFDYCIDEFKSMGIEKITGRFDAKAEEAKAVVRYGRDVLGLKFADSDHILLRYTLDQLYTSGAINTVMKSENIDKIASRLTDIKDPALRAFYVSNYDGSHIITLSSLANEYSRYYIRKEKIHGAIVAERTGDMIVQIRDLVLDELAMKDNIYMFLFSSCLDEVRRRIGDDAQIYFYFSASSPIYNGLLNMFTPPEEEYVVLEYKREIS